MADEPRVSQNDKYEWSQIWHVPTLVTGLLLLVVGTYLALSSRTVPDIPGTLDSAENAIVSGQFDLAQIELAKVQEHIDHASASDQGRALVLSGDRIFLEQQAQNRDRHENHENIDQHYRQAEAMAVDLDPSRIHRWAQTLISLDRHNDALALIDRLQGQAPRVRYALVRRIIERTQAKNRMSTDQLKPLLDRYEAELLDESDKQVRRTGNLWLLTQRALGLLNNAKPEQVIEELLKKIPRLEEKPGMLDLAPLYILLAKAYQQSDEYEHARIQYMHAQQLLDPVDKLNADIFVGLGQLALAQSDDPQEALDLFSQAVRNFPDARSYLEALLGKADSEAKLGLHDEAIKHLRQACDQLLQNVNHDVLLQGQLYEIAFSCYSSSADRGDYKLALDYLMLLKVMYAPHELPLDLLINLAVVHTRLAEQRMTEVPHFEPGDESTAVDANLSRQRRGEAYQDAAVHYKKAGEYYRQHAGTVTIKDNEAHGESLWRAAESFDRAQLWLESIKVYSQFASSRESDQRYLTVIHRLGLAYQAQGKQLEAIEQFKKLIEEKPQSQAAFDSYVPLARAYQSLDKGDLAKRLLNSVLTDHPSITPDSRPYRDALIELGRLHYEQQEFSEAIRRFAMAIDRDQQEVEDGSLRFYLADAHRRSIEQIDQELEQVKMPSKEKRFRQERIKRLNAAQVLYEQVIAHLEKREDDQLSSMQRLYLRNAYFYRADCAYSMKNWDQAISFYDTAAKRWGKHAISLVALIQIVNAYAEQGDFKEAKIANNRARHQLKQIPEDAFDDPSLPMTRRYWQNWLRWSHELFESQANVTAFMGSASSGDIQP